MAAILQAASYWLVLAGILHVLIGSLLFVIINGIGVVDAVMLSRAALGKSTSGMRMTLGIAISIMLWPKTMRRLSRSPRMVDAMIYLFLGTFALSVAVSRIVENYDLYPLARHWYALARNLWGR